MIGYVSGKIIDMDDKAILIQTGGVGFNIYLGYSLEKSLNIGEEAAFYTHMNVREDAIELYGFATQFERKVFYALISVNGIGPKTAVNMIASSQALAIVEAVLNENRKALQQLPGCGKKTADRLILELKDRFDPSILAEINALQPHHTEKSLAASSVLEDVKVALQTLGYQASEIDRIEDQLLALADESDEQALLKKALALLKSK